MVPRTDVEPKRSLQQQLDEITANTRALVQPERLARTDQVIEELRATGTEAQVLQPPSEAPGFCLAGANGKKVQSADLVALGPVVLKFFRGRWCPYDMTELETWQALYPRLRSHGAMVVGISPQTPRQNAFTAERHGLQFPLLSDPKAEIAAAYGLAYTVPEPARVWYRSMLVNIPFLNGDESWRLPLPATVVIGRPENAQAGAEVRSMWANADHRVRPEPTDILAALEASP